MQTQILFLVTFCLILVMGELFGTVYILHECFKAFRKIIHAGRAKVYLLMAILPPMILIISTYWVSLKMSGMGVIDPSHIYFLSIAGILLGGIQYYCLTTIREISQKQKDLFIEENIETDNYNSMYFYDDKGNRMRP